MTNKQRKYAHDLRQQAHNLVEDAKWWTVEHPSFTPDKLEAIETNAHKLDIAIDKMSDEQVLMFFTRNPVKGYFHGAYTNYNRPLRELMAILKVCGCW